MKTELSKRELIVIRILLIIAKMVGRDHQTIKEYWEIDRVWKLINGEDE